MILVVAGVATMVASAAGVSCGVDAVAASQPSAQEEGSQLTPPYRIISLTSNALYDLALTPDIGVGIGLTRNISLAADYMYGWWSKTSSDRCWRLSGGNIEGRYYFAPAAGAAYSGHYVGVCASAFKYDFKFGASRQGQLSDGCNYSAGISYGYTLPLARRFSFNFSVAVGYMWGSYMKYRRIDNCDVWLSTHSRRWFGPVNAGVTVVWHLGTPNAAKGGRR